MHSAIKAVISTVPWTDTDTPLLAPAVLKNSLHNVGIRSTTVDLNAEIKQWFRQNLACHEDVLKFFLTEEINPNSKQAVKTVLDFMAQRLLAFNTEWVILSLLTYLSQNTTKWLCFRIKQLDPLVKIVIGGPGAATSLKSTDQFANDLLKLGLIDFFIVGDGEESLPALFNGNTQFPGINSFQWQQIKDINVNSFADFDDYDWTLYTAKRIPLVGSRGCVRTCTFCDIHEHWSKYQYRTGANIFSEMLFQYEKYGIHTFMFCDSLVNGNQREFRTLIKLLADFNQFTAPDLPIKWSGSFIVRPQDQMKEDDWRLMALSGCVMLMVGIESFVEHIRHHIGKKFSNADIDHMLEMGRTFSINLSLLMVVGYVTETEEDFQQALLWIKDHKHYAGNPIHSVHIGSGLGILQGTWLDRNKQMLNIISRSDQVTQDWYRAEIDSTPEKRMEWHKIMQDHLQLHGFQVFYAQDNHVLIEQYLNAQNQH